MEIEWVDGFKISIRIHSNNEVTISANKEGLLSLARQLGPAADGLHREKGYIVSAGGDHGGA